MKRIVLSLAVTGVVGLVAPAAASADPSSPPRCFSSIVTASAQAGQAGIIVRAVEPAAGGSFVVFIKEQLC